MRTAKVRLLGFAIALVVVAGNVVGVEEKKTEKKKKLPAIAADVVKIEIERVSTGRDVEEVFTTSEDEKKIAELLNFFPELGRNSDDAVDWPSTHVLKFLRKNGECFAINVRLSSNMNCWSGVGVGDWPLKDPDGLKKLMDSLGIKEKKKDEKKEARASAGDVPMKKASEIIPDIVKVEIQRASNRKKGRRQEQSVIIEDKKKIVELLAFFPEIGQLTNRKGLWVADYHIKCTLKNDDPITIRVSWDLKWWTYGEEELSHWRLKDPDKFEKLIDNWIKKK